MMKALRTSVLGLALIPAAASGLAGCVIASDEIEMNDEGEQVAQVQQAYGESTCLTVSPDATDSEVLSENEFGTMHVSGSTYGSSQCTNAFVVEYTPSSIPVYVDVRAGWGDAGDETQYECQNGRVKFQLHTYASGAWTSQGETSSHGTWNSSTSTCSWFPDTGNSWQLFVPSGAGITKYRATAQAYTTFCTLMGCTRTYYPVSVLASGEPDL